MLATSSRRLAAVSLHHGKNHHQRTTYRLFFSKPKSSPTTPVLKNKSNHHRGSGGKGIKNKEHVRPYVSSMTPPEELTKALATARVAWGRTGGQQQQQAKEESWSSWWQRAFQWYSRKLSTHPLTTKSLTGAIIAALGDVLCQAATFRPEENNEEENNQSNNKKSSVSTKWTSFWNNENDAGWDATRSFHFFLLGFVFVAPTSHYWYGGLAKHAWTKGQCFTQITKRVVLDQFVWTPVFFVIWLSSFWTLQDDGGKEKNSGSSSSLQTQLAHHLPEVMIANWILWIPAQYLNFYACPVKFQVLFCNVVELAWNAYLSFATGGSEHHHHGQHHGNEHKVEESTISAAAAASITTTQQPQQDIPLTSSTTTLAAAAETI